MIGKRRFLHMYSAQRIFANDILVISGWIEVGLKKILIKRVPCFS